MRNREENDVRTRLVLNEVLRQTNHKDIKNSKTLDANNSGKEEDLAQMVFLQIMTINS